MKTFMLGTAAVIALAGAAMGQTPQAFSNPIGGPAPMDRSHSESPAALLWDQSGYDVGAQAFVNQVFDDFPTYSSYQVADITTGGATWNVTKVTVYFTRGANGSDLFNQSNVNMANVQIYPKTGCLPDNSNTPPQLTLPCTLFSPAFNVWEISVDTSGTPQFQNLNGNYWVGVTPKTNFARDGQEFQFQTLTAGMACESTWRNPGGDFLFGTDWLNLSGSIGNGTTYDGAIKIEGSIGGGGGGYTLTLTGTCPGTVRVAWAGAPANTQQGIVFGLNLGNTTIPTGPCQGIVLGIAGQVQLFNTIGTGNGSGAVNGNAGPGACHHYIQLVAVGNPCKKSNVAQIP